jgi:hypothetical protein
MWLLLLLLLLLKLMWDQHRPPPLQTQHTHAQQVSLHVMLTAL